MGIAPGLEIWNFFQRFRVGLVEIIRTPLCCSISRNGHTQIVLVLLLADGFNRSQAGRQRRPSFGDGKAHECAQRTGYLFIFLFLSHFGAANWWKVVLQQIEMKCKKEKKKGLPLNQPHKED